ncbi:MAG TPA: TetR/AcrR family transcriptional regulator [Desulfovibrio sp.]|nr:TetR/AcrR family transcriptional regulator [Desulfovibrio sp.]
MARRQQEKSQETQQELLAAALELFQERGFFGTTIADITKKAGYAKGSFYRHWQSKDDITLQLIEAKLASCRARRTEALARAATLEQVLEAIWDFLESIMEDKSWARLFLEFTIHASCDEGLKASLAQSAFRLSDAVFAELVRPWVGPKVPGEKLGALNTCLFEGFLIHGVLGTGTLNKRDIRDAAKRLILTLAADAGK